MCQKQKLVVCHSFCTSEANLPLNRRMKHKTLPGLCCAVNVYSSRYENCFVCLACCRAFLFRIQQKRTLNLSQLGHNSTIHMTVWIIYHDTMARSVCDVIIKTFSKPPKSSAGDKQQKNENGLSFESVKSEGKRRTCVNQCPFLGWWD